VLPYASFIHEGETLGDISLYNSFRFGIANPTPVVPNGIRCLLLSREICMAVTTQAGNRTGTRCATCSAALEPGARFCGECGASMHRPQAEPSQSSQSSCNNAPGGGQTPSFARPKGRNTVDPAVNKELGSLLVLLARERVFLIMHWAIFVTLSLIGFSLAMKCYTEFHGDHMSKLMMSITPMLFINLTALVCLTPIKGTKREIERLEEKIAYLKFSVRFKHLL
jgi:hypothetical protein